MTNWKRGGAQVLLAATVAGGCSMAATATQANAAAGANAPRTTGAPSRVRTPHSTTARGAAAQTYTNPILPSDYSDPDVIRDGNEYLLVASTFSFVPGLPILSSPDLVHWRILTHALPGPFRFAPQYDLQNGNRYGRGVWAPAIRRHAGRLYLFFPTPDEGIFMVSAASAAGPWTAPVAVLPGPNLEDPCPFWDDDGNAYLIHSRTGAGPLILHRMSADATHVLDDGKEIVRDREHLPTLEGPKLYKRDGWYYIFAPFGGVSTGKQVTLRARNIYGPYEPQVSLEQGTSPINGPHQGGWVTTPDGKDYFVHFQSRGAHGRIVHLEPMRWQDGWPVMGTAALLPPTDPAAAHPGQPVAEAPLPAVVAGAASIRPQTSDDFSGTTLGPQWEWNHNPVPAAWSLREHPGALRLHALPAADLFQASNTLTQQMQSESLVFTARVDVRGEVTGGEAGLAMFEQRSSGIAITTAANGGHHLRWFHIERAKDGMVSPLSAEDAESVAVRQTPAQAAAVAQQAPGTPGKSAPRRTLATLPGGEPVVHSSGATTHFGVVHPDGDDATTPASGTATPAGNPAAQSGEPVVHSSGATTHHVTMAPESGGNAQTGSQPGEVLPHPGESLPHPTEATVASPVLLLRVTVHHDTVQYSYSADDGRTFHDLGPATPIDFSWWKGARPALFHYRTPGGTGDAGFIDVDRVTMEALP